MGIYVAMAAGLLLVTVPQWLMRREFLRLDLGQKRAMIEAFEPRGFLRLALPLILAAGLLGAVTFAKDQLWFAVVFGVLILASNAFVAIANVARARRLGLPTSFRRMLFVASAVRVGVLIAGWGALIWSIAVARS